MLADPAGAGICRFPFLNPASRSEKAEIEAHFSSALAHTKLDLSYIDVNGLNPLDRQFLVERQIISRELSNGEGPRGVAISSRENVAIMVNEEDHLRVQFMLSGFRLSEVWDAVDQLNDDLEEHLAYVYSPQLGYLTACPTNVGTGIRVGVMLHLPGLVQTKQIDKVFRPPENQLGRARPVRRGEPGVGRLLPDLQPANSGQERARADQNLD